MKRFFHALLASALVLLCMLPLLQSDVSAADSGKCGDSITWSLDKGILTLTGSGEMYDYDYNYGTTYDYTKAKTPWARYTPQITAVKADPAITHIGNMAFFHCTKLQTVELTGVLTVGKQAFEGCSALKTVSLPAAVTVEDSAFHSCTALTSLNAPAVMSIGTNAFANCYYLTEATLPAAESIGTAAFTDCGNLISVSAPKLKSLQPETFYDCIDLVTAELPAAETVGDKAFGNCTKLQSIDLPLAAAVGEGAFSNCYDLQSVSLPKVTVLRKDVFKNCESLTALSFPAATATERYAFLNCSGLTSLSLPEVTAIPAYAFELLTGLESVELPKVSFLGAYAFSGCASLRTVYLPKLTQMQAHAFRLCEGLTEANLPLLTAVPNYAFYQCTSLQSVNAPLLTSIGDHAFEECYALQIIDFPAVTHIGNCAFYLCTSMTEAYVPAVKTIDYNGFNNCRSLQLLSISTDLEQVNARAFEACKSLKSVYVSKTKAEWKPLTIDGYNNEYFLQAKAIYDAPPFSIEPMPATVSVVKGYTAELSISAHGSGCVYQWQMCLPGTDRWVDLSPTTYPTANSAKLFYGPVIAEDEGLQLRCAVTNRYGDTLTSEATELRITPFADVAVTDYYFSPVLWAVENGITAGISPVMFGSDNPCTRGQVVTFLWRAAGSPAPAGSEMPFTDVAADAYYRTAVLWAVEQGITKGTTDTTFGPDDTCTRAQIVTMLWRAAGSPVMHVFELPDIEITTPDLPVEYTADTEIPSKSPFSDVAPMDYYYQAVLWAVDGGITAGTAADSFSPDTPCTRAQIVTMLYKVPTDN